VLLLLCCVVVVVVEQQHTVVTNTQTVYSDFLLILTRDLTVSSVATTTNVTSGEAQSELSRPKIPS